MIPFFRPDRRSKLFGGRGDVLVESLRGALCEPFTAALACQLTAGGRVGEHVQESDDELVIVLGGAGTLLVDGASRRVSAGSVVALRLGQRLAIECDAEAPLDYLIVKARRG